MTRRCDSCGTPLPGKGHGMPYRNQILCGRREVQRSNADNTKLVQVKTPGCSR